MSSTIFFHAETSSDKTIVKAKIETYTNSKKKYIVLDLKQEEQNNDLHIFLNKEVTQRLAEEIVCANGRLNQ